MPWASIMTRKFWLQNIMKTFFVTYTSSDRSTGESDMPAINRVSELRDGYGAWVSSMGTAPKCVTLPYGEQRASLHRVEKGAGLFEEDSACGKFPRKRAGAGGHMAFQPAGMVIAPREPGAWRLTGDAGTGLRFPMSGKCRIHDSRRPVSQSALST